MKPLSRFGDVSMFLPTIKNFLKELKAKMPNAGFDMPTEAQVAMLIKKNIKVSNFPLGAEAVWAIDMNIVNDPKSNYVMSRGFGEVEDKRVTHIYHTINTKKKQIIIGGGYEYYPKEFIFPVHLTFPAN